jgi:uncharacterized protein YukE
MRSVASSPAPPAHGYAPFATSNETPGDANSAQQLAQRYAATADEISSQVQKLRRLADNSSSYWQGQAADKFKSHASDLADRIEKAKSRYTAAADAINQFAAGLADVQRRAYEAIEQAQSAQQTMHTAKARLDSLPTSSDATDPNVTAERQTQMRAHDDASAAYGKADRDYGDAVNDYRHLADQAASGLNDVINHDDVQDGWLDKHFQFIKDALKIIGAIVIALVIVAFIIGTFGGGIAILATLATVATWLAAGLTAVTLVAHMALALTGHGSWTDVIFDVVSLATFGVGLGAGKLLEGLAGASKTVGASVAAGRAGRAAFAAESGLPGWLISLPGAKTLLGVLPGLSGAVKGASAAAKAAAGDIAGLEATTSTLGRAAMFGDAKVAEALATINGVADAVPGTFRIGLMQIGGSVLGPAFTISNVLSLGATGAGEASALADPGDGISAADQAHIDAISNTWSMPMLHLAPS